MGGKLIAGGLRSGVDSSDGPAMLAERRIRNRLARVRPAAPAA